MNLSPFGRCAKRVAVAMALVGLGSAGRVRAQGPRTTATPQKIDREYTARIKKATPGPGARHSVGKPSVLAQGSFFLGFNAILNWNGSERRPHRSTPHGHGRAVNSPPPH